MVKKAYNNIIIFNLRKIGDTIMATAAASILRQAYPQAKITMLVKPLTREIVEHNSVIDQVLLYNYTHHAKLAELQQTAKQLQHQKFDLAIVIDNKVRSALLAYLAKIPTRVGFEAITLRNIYLRALYTKIYPIDYAFMGTQQVVNHQRFLNRFTGGNYQAQMVLPEIATTEQQKLLSLLPLESGKPNVALCLHSGVPFKDWPLKYFAQVIESLHKKTEAAFYVVGAPADHAYGVELQKMLSFPLENLCGTTSIAALGWFLGRFDLLLSVDTGTAHLAAAAQVPTVVVFAGTSHLHWAPYGQHVCAIAPQIDCYPCTDKQRRHCKGYPCLQKVSVAAVEKACEKLLDKAN